MTFRSLLYAAALSFVVSPVLAQSAETTDAILKAWSKWAADYNISESSISVGFDGQILASDGKGRDPLAAYPVLSLSKAVTAVCLNKVLAEQGLSFDMPLADLQDQFDKVKLTIPNQLRDATLGQVVTMTSGMSPDAVQGRRLFNKNRNNGDTRNIGFSRIALQKDVVTGQSDTFFYNNGGYAVLGALLEALTGEDNVTACKPRVFPDGAGETAGFDPEWIAFGGAGGWGMSSADYLAFVMEAFAPGGEISQNITKLPNFQHDRGWQYGLGTYFRQRAPRNIFWHFGTVCDVQGGDKGAFFVSYDNGYAVSVNFNACSLGDLGVALDRVLWDAAH